jgi:hypothetical protein
MLQEMLIPNAVNLVELSQLTARHEKDNDSLSLDPVSQQRFTALQLMDQLESEGKERLGREFSERRGYSLEQIAEFDRYLDAWADAVDTGVDEDELVFAMGVADGQLPIPSDLQAAVENRVLRLAASAINEFNAGDVNGHAALLAEDAGSYGLPMPIALNDYPALTAHYRSQNQQIKIGLVAEILLNAQRETRYGPWPDPVAQDILAAKKARDNLAQLDRLISSRGLLAKGIAGAGASSIVIDAGHSVIRLGVGELAQRAPIAEMLQTTESGYIGHIRYEIVPRVSTVNITDADVDVMAQTLATKGYFFTDRGTDNLGRLPDGKLVVLDPGAVRAMPNARPDDAYAIAAYQVANLLSKSNPVPTADASLAIDLVMRDGESKGRPAPPSMRDKTIQRNTAAMPTTSRADNSKNPPSLTPEMLAEIASDYVLAHMTTTARTVQPVAIILAAQPGAGLPALVHELHDDYATKGGFIAVDRALLPLADGSNTDKLVHAVMHEGMRAKRNLVIDAPTNDSDAALSIARQLRFAGYKVELHAIAVNDQISYQRNASKFERDRNYNTATQAVSHDYHDKSFHNTEAMTKRMEFAGVVDRIVIYNRLHDRVYDRPALQGTATAAKELNSTRTRLTDFERTSLAHHWDELSDKLNARPFHPNQHAEVQIAMERAHHTLRRSTEAANHYDDQYPERRGDSQALALAYGERLAQAYRSGDRQLATTLPELKLAFAAKDKLDPGSIDAERATQRIAETLAMGQLPRIQQPSSLERELASLKKNLNDITDSLQIVQSAGMQLDAHDRQELAEAQRKFSDFVAKNGHQLGRANPERPSPDIAPSNVHQNNNRHSMRPS